VTRRGDRSRRLTANGRACPVDVVDVQRSALLEQREEFVLGAVEAAHAGVGLCPNNEIQGNWAEFRGSRVNDRPSAPVYEGAADAAVTKVG
jgi:hypothetical protein